MEAPHVPPSAIMLEDEITSNFTLNCSGTVFCDNIEELDRCDPSNPFFNCSLKEYLLNMMGPQQLALSVAVPITVVYVLIFVTGVVGNVSVCIVIVRHPSMRTATNYYLFSLAVSDLALLLLGLPNDISIYWHQYPYSLGIGFCKLRALLSEASSYVSVLTIVAFSMERYLAICHPLHLYTMSGLQRPVRIIAALWTISLVCAMPFFLQTTINYLDYPPNSNNRSVDSAFCAMLSQPNGWPIWEMSSVVFFILPALVILVLYCRMGFRIRARSRHHLGKGVKGSVHGETRQTQSRKAIIRMLAAVVVAFFLCWAPFHAQRLMYIYGQNWTHFKDINEWMFSVTGWLYYVSSTVNPILYNVMSNRYRVAFKETLCCQRKNSHNGIGFSREQSSFRETTIAASGEGSHLVRVRSVSSEPLHRSNTTSRLSRHSTLSKDYNLNHNKTRWSDSNQSTKKWNNNDAKTNRKSVNHSPFRGMFSNFNSQEQNEANAKRAEIKLETETNNLLNSVPNPHRENYEMDNIKKYNNALKVENSNSNIYHMPDSRSDSHLIVTNNKPICLNDHEYTVAKIEFSNNVLDSAVPIRHEPVQVIVAKPQNNGLKMLYPNSAYKGIGFATNVIRPHEDYIEEISDDSKMKEMSNPSETRI